MKRMKFLFTAKDITKLAHVLQVKPQRLDQMVRFEVNYAAQHRRLALEIYSNIDIGNRKGNLISVYTSTAHLQLHFCTGYVVSNLLGEITFVSEADGKLSGLTIEREGGCSLYANVDRKILSGDFTQLGPEVMLSGIALSLTEAVLPPQSVRSQVKKTKRRTVRKRS